MFYGACFLEKVLIDLNGAVIRDFEYGTIGPAGKYWGATLAKSQD